MADENDGNKYMMEEDSCMVPDDNLQNTNEIEIDGSTLSNDEVYEDEDENIISYEEVGDENEDDDIYIQDQSFQMISKDGEAFPVVTTDGSFQQEGMIFFI